MKIVGSLIIAQKIQPFIFDDESNELALNQFSWDRAVPLNQFQEFDLRHKIRQFSPVQIDEILIGKYFCETCQKWFNANNQEWSYGMCMSCSLDRDSDFADSFDDDE